ncbi:hypothetical protein C8R45DRAFT_1068818 [Mycena sanguinolenta]|nr:hypothetical protein C8R45DRAFT_1068818 [Mycena sanguinolenta]
MCPNWANSTRRTWGDSRRLLLLDVSVSVPNYAVDFLRNPTCGSPLLELEPPARGMRWWVAPPSLCTPTGTACLWSHRVATGGSPQGLYYPDWTLHGMRRVEDFYWIVGGVSSYKKEYTNQRVVVSQKLATPQPLSPEDAYASTLVAISTRQLVCVPQVRPRPILPRCCWLSGINSQITVVRLNAFLNPVWYSGILVLQRFVDVVDQGFKPFWNYIFKDRRWPRFFTVNTAVSGEMICQPLISQFGSSQFPTATLGEYSLSSFLMLLGRTSKSLTQKMFEELTRHLQRTHHEVAAAIIPTTVSVPVQFFYVWRSSEFNQIAKDSLTTKKTGTGPSNYAFDCRSSFVFDFALPKLYNNGLVSTLNARAGAVHCPIPTEQDENPPSEMHRHVEVHRDNREDILSLQNPYGVRQVKLQRGPDSAEDIVFKCRPL